MRAGSCTYIGSTAPARLAAASGSWSTRRRSRLYQSSWRGGEDVMDEVGSMVKERLGYSQGRRRSGRTTQPEYSLKWQNSCCTNIAYPVKCSMRIGQLIPPSEPILDCTPVREVHAAGLALLSEAFVRAGFERGPDIAAHLVCAGSPKTSPSLLWGGFEVTDSASNSGLRVMAAIGFSANGPPGKAADVAGFSYAWVVTPALDIMANMPREPDQLQSMRVALHRILATQLADYGDDSDAVQKYFHKALTEPSFHATPGQAAEFVSRLVDALAP